MVDRDAFRAAKVRQAAEPRTLALIRTYYPEHLRVLVIRCILGQLGGLRARGCKSPYCPLCSPRQSKKRTLEQFARFEAATPHNRPTRIGHHVYTLPPQLRHHLWEPGGFEQWRRATRATIRAVEGADVAGVMNLHMLGDRDITRMHPHWDVLLNGYVLADGELVRHRPPRIDFDLAREIYAKNLAEAFGLPEPPAQVDLWLGGRGTARSGRPAYAQSYRTLIKLVQYSARNVYQPENAWYSDATPQQGDWYYHPRHLRRPDIYHGLSVIRNFAEIDRLMRGKKWHVWFGYMQNRNAGRFRPRPPEGRE